MKISELEKLLRKHSNTTKTNMAVPFDLKEEIENFKKQAMSKHKNNKLMKRTAAFAAVLALCIVTVCMTPLASSIKGFFTDITRFDGAITGTLYENASNDIKMDVLELFSENGNIIIPLELTFANPTQAPFPYIQEIAIAEYKIIDSNNKKIADVKNSANNAEKGIAKEGKSLVNLSISGKKITPGKEYTIVIEKMYGLSKADAPLHITGIWKCDFIK